MEKRHRTFIAINLPDYAKKELGKYQEKWQNLPAKWTAKDNLHITVEFLGDLTDQEIAEVCKICREVAKRHKSFSINLEKILYGPAKKIPPKMVWVQGEKSDELADLRDDLQNCLVEEIRFRPEARGFSPHITLARIKEWEWRRIEPDERPEVNEEINLNFTAESIDVMESELKKGGPVYTVLESCILKE